MGMAISLGLEALIKCQAYISVLILDNPIGHTPECGIIDIRVLFPIKKLVDFK